MPPKTLNHTVEYHQVKIFLVQLVDFMGGQAGEFYIFLSFFFYPLPVFFNDYSG